MSYLAQRPDQNTTTEANLLTALNNLPAGGIGTAIQKTTATTFNNVQISGILGTGISNSLTYWLNPTTVGSVTLGTGLSLVNGTLSASSSGGTVTTISVVTANGISGSVANATTTPAITLSLGAITPSSVNGLTLSSQAIGFTIAGGTTSKTLTVPLDASVSGTNTGDQTNISGNAGTATVLATSRNLWGQGFTGAGDVTGSLTSVGDITGGASSMTIQAGTGASRTLTFKTTTSGSTATTALTLAADQSATFANTVNATTFVGALTGTASGNLVSGGALGTPSSGSLANCTGLPIAGLTASTLTALGVGSIELGAASDTTIARVSAGVISVEGVTIPSISSTNTLTNKRITPRILSATSYTTDTGTSLNCDTLDQFIVTAQAGALKLNNPTGTPTDGQKLLVAITGTGARALTYDTQFEASTVALPTTTVTTARLNIGFIWRADTSKWICVAVA